MKYHDTWGTKSSRGLAGGSWGNAAMAGVLACALALGAGIALTWGGTAAALAEEDDLTATTVGSSSATTNLADGGTYDLSNYRGSDKAQILRIKNAGTYYFVQSGPDDITNVQIKVDASLSGKIVVYGGAITATGGPHAAGIGSASADGAGNGGNAAGIGAGKDGDLDAGINLSGGDITANAGSDAAAIGTGTSGTLKENRGISITGGTVTTSGGSVGMGFGASGSADEGAFLKISGGNIYTDSVSKDSDFRITIVGGLVATNLGDGIVNESGQNVYWMALPVPNPGADVDSIASNSDFSARSVHPDDNGYVFVYLPASNGNNADENKVTLVQNGKTYQYHDKRTETGDVNSPGNLKMDCPGGWESMPKSTLSTSEPLRWFIWTIPTRCLPQTQPPVSARRRCPSCPQRSSRSAPSAPRIARGTAISRPLRAWRIIENPGQGTDWYGRKRPFDHRVGVAGTGF